MPNSKHRRQQIRLAPEVYAQPGAVALLTTCTTDRKRIFEHPNHADLVMSEISRLHNDDSRVLGFCIMPDHVHLLVLNLNSSLLDFMRVLKGRTAHLLRSHGAYAVWQGSFHDHLLRRNEDISGTLRYLLENPVRAGLVDSWTKYRWCGSMQWPEINCEFFTVKPGNILWAEVIPQEKSSLNLDADPGRG